MLIDKMKIIGEIKFAEMTGRGKAIVCFKNKRDAERCIGILLKMFYF